MHQRTANPVGITPCPGCGVESSENYGGAGLCWPCWARKHPDAVEEKPKAAEPSWVTFRRHVIDKLWNPKLAGYINPNVFVGKCPSCDGVVAVRFKGRSDEVDLQCYGAGCSEAAIAGAIGLAVKS